jgi:hypothetical protein
VWPGEEEGGIIESRMPIFTRTIGTMTICEPVGTADLKRERDGRLSCKCGSCGAFAAGRIYREAKLML